MPARRRALRHALRGPRPRRAVDRRRLIAERPDVVFLLAAVVSGEAESDFDKGYAVNLDATRRLFEAIRRERDLSGGAYRPRMIFASSIAVFGAPFPETIGDDFLDAR